MCTNYTSLVTCQTFCLEYDVSFDKDCSTEMQSHLTVTLRSCKLLIKVSYNGSQYIMHCLCLITDISNGLSGSSTDLYQTAVTHIITFPNTCIWIQLVRQ